MNFRSRFVSIFSATFLMFALGCDEKKAKTAPDAGIASSAADAEAQIVLGLETQQDSAHCRSVMQQLDALPSIAKRPVHEAAELEEIRAFLSLTPAEATEVGQANFSLTDAAYLEECFLLRAGVRSLRVDAVPPIERATAVFDWVCRLVYIDNRIPWTSPPGTTMQTGFGVLLSRTYAILAAWQQAGLDGCIVAPASLSSTPTIKPPTRPNDLPIYAPIQVCGVRIDKDIFLFDVQSGKPILQPDGKRVLSLAQAKAAPDMVPGFTAEQIKSWQVFLTPSLCSLSKRMSWLQGQNPGNVGLKLFTDLKTERSEFKQASADVAIGSWNPPKDNSTATRVLSLYVTEEDSTESKRARRDLHSQLLVPLEHMPKTGLEGTPLYFLQSLFMRPFNSLSFGPTTPRYLLVRGQFQEAISTLEDTKTKIGNARARFEKDPDLGKDFAAWADSIRKLFGAVNVARESNPGAAADANKALEDFRRQPRNYDIETAFIWGSAARPLGASVDYLMAECVHERAERAQRDSPARAKAQWKNAEEWWGRFLDSSAQANGRLPAREAHARMLLERCRQHTAK